MRKDKKYKKLDLKQSELKSALHTNIRDYYDYRVRTSGKDSTSPPISMAELQRQQKEINRIRKLIKKSPIKLIRDLRKTLKHL